MEKIGILRNKVVGKTHTYQGDVHNVLVERHEDKEYVLHQITQPRRTTRKLMGALVKSDVNNFHYEPLPPAEAARIAKALKAR